MEHANIADCEGVVHLGLFNIHLGSLVDLSCGAGTLQVLGIDPLSAPQPTTDTFTCPDCREVETAGPDAPGSWENLGRAHAEAVLALADREGCVAQFDYPWLQAAFERMKLTPPPGSKMYGVIREHLAELLTERARTVPEGSIEVLVRYLCHTGGAVMVPIGIGDRLVRHWILTSGRMEADVVAIEGSSGRAVVTLRTEHGDLVSWPGTEIRRYHLKLDRAPAGTPAETNGKSG